MKAGVGRVYRLVLSRDDVWMVDVDLGGGLGAGPRRRRSNGKSHLAAGRAIAACRQRKRVRLPGMRRAKLDVDAASVERRSMIGGSDRRIVGCQWDDLVLDSHVRSMLKDDFESFFEREAWFREARPLRASPCSSPPT